MESKKLNRNIFSIFWCILYFMPVLVLILSLLGNYIIYKDSANNLKVEYGSNTLEPVSYEFFEEAKIYDYSLNGLYLGTYLTDDVILNKIITSNLSFISLDDFISGLYMAPLLTFVLDDGHSTNVMFFLLRLSDTYLLGTLKATDLDYFDTKLNVLWVSNDFSLGDISLTKGWDVDSFTTDYLTYGTIGIDLDSFTSFSINADITIEQQEILAPLFTPSPSAKYVSVNNNGYFQFDLIQENNTYYMSFFDISMFNTDNTFKKFQLPFLRNGFEKVFGLLQFESSFTSSFVITTFVWFIQFMLLHVLVDTLTFIFKLYHKLMEKVV